MQRFYQIQVGVPTLSAIYVGAAAIWYCAVILGLRGGKTLLGGVSDFWVVAFFASPLLCVLLAPSFTRLYFEGNRSCRWMFWPAIVFGLSPAFWLGALLLVTLFLESFHG